MPLTVYLAGPITGQSYDRVTGWREEFGLMISNVRTLSPMRGKKYLKDYVGSGPIGGGDDTRGQRIMSSSRAIYSRDLNDIRRSDVIVANFLDAKEKSTGTIFELGYARALGKMIIVVMESEGNVHDHPFVRECANFIVPKVADAEMILEQMV